MASDGGLVKRINFAKEIPNIAFIAILWYTSCLFS